MALEKIDGLTAAYVNAGIQLHYSAEGSFDKDKVAEILKPFKMAIKEANKADKLPF
ncbi:hypothetical protein NT6N_40520 [Oceaniferula spumae]|uniref:Uncharacterized protein n=1 Tax=Oceaniferula spumae TaxID=2979115 RepID=A0AAT9FSK6_9BACT